MNFHSTSAWLISMQHILFFYIRKLNILEDLTNYKLKTKLGINVQSEKDNNEKKYIYMYI